MKTAMVVVSAAFALAAFGCSSGTNSKEDPNSVGSSQTCNPDVAAMCEAFCNDNHACDKSIDVQTCQDSCTNGLAVQWGKLRCDLVTNLQSCYDATDCASKLDGSGQKDCLTQELASIAPSDADSTFCASLKDAATQCGQKFSEGDCMNLTKAFGDAALSDAQACTSKACSAIPSCVEAALPGYKL
ncbi:MAG TPA: hypothetical protein VIF62_27865 [Labilithrix sp.]